MRIIISTIGIVVLLNEEDMSQKNMTPTQSRLDKLVSTLLLVDVLGYTSKIIWRRCVLF